MSGKKVKYLGRVALGVILLSLFLAGVVFATSITVDGDPTDWPGDDSGSHTLGTPSCTIGNSGCALVETDGDETPDTTDGIRDQYDIEQVWFTNDTTNGYFRIDTYDNVVFVAPPTGSSTLKFCIDEDQNASTGSSISGCGDVGVECLVTVDDGSTVTVFDLEASGSSSGSVSSATRFAEVSFPLAECSLTNATYNLEVFFDNGDQDNDDNVPDTGATSMPTGSGSPTAIQLQDITARSANQVALPLVAGSLILLALLVVFIRRAQRQRL